MVRKRRSNKNKNKVRAQRTGVENRLTVLPRASVPSDVMVRLRLGFVTSLSVGVGASVMRLNSPFGIVPGWSARAADFQSYRVVAIAANITPVDTLNGVSFEPANPGKVYASVLYSAVVGVIANPANALSILEYPSADIRPFNTANSRSHRKIAWHTRDLNALVFGQTGSPPLAEEVLVAVAFFSAPAAGSSPTVEVSGWMDVEFRGLASI